jgi:hypothetical protein
VKATEAGAGSMADKPLRIKSMWETPQSNGVDFGLGHTAINVFRFDLERARLPRWGFCGLPHTRL